MAGRINNGFERGRNPDCPLNAAAADAPIMLPPVSQNTDDCCGCESCSRCEAAAEERSCVRSVEFCETITLHESFDASDICPATARIAYDPGYLGFTVDEQVMQASLPCGGTCPVNVFKISLTGAIPYVISAGTVTSTCGSAVNLSVSGSTMVDTVIGYRCCDCEPELSPLTCANVTPCIDVSTARCGCSDKTNVTFSGYFSFSNLPSCL